MSPMTDTKRQLAPVIRRLLPPVTPRLVLLALLGILLFGCGLVYGVWLIIRSRHRQPGAT
jgi:hypothetical protein